MILLSLCVGQCARLQPWRPRPLRARSGRQWPPRDLLLPLSWRLARHLVHHPGRFL